MLSFLKEPWELLKSLQLARQNMIAAWPKSYYRREFIVENFFGREFFIVNHPDGVQRVLISNGKNYRKGTSNTQTLKPLLGKGLFVSEGELWTRHRRIASPAAGNNRLDGYTATIVATAQEMVDRWKARGPEFETDVAEPFTLLTAEIISRLMFHYPLGAEGIQLFQAFQEYQASHGRVHIMELFGMPAWVPRPGTRRARRAVAKFDEVLLRIIEAARRRGPPPIDDLIQMLLAHRDEQGQPMDPSLVRDEVASIFLAGHETTAITLCWAFWLVDQHPSVGEKVREEVDRVLGSRVPAYADYEQLTFCRAVIDETLRLYPPVHIFSRLALGEDEVCGHRIPAGANIAISPWLLHRHRLYWEDPAAFKPERFLPENSGKINRFAYVPFGAGHRICMGKNLGLLEAVLVFALIARSFRLSLPEGHVVEPVARMTLRPKGALLMRIQARN